MFLFKAHNGRIICTRLYVDAARARDVLEGREPRRFPKMTSA
ncbi:hypothetical protein V1283_002111 [Bradyrhizobium sp. AZCC 2262]